MTTLKLRNKIRETRTENLTNNKEMFEMGLISNHERFSLDYKVNTTFRKEMSYTK